MCACPEWQLTGPHSWAHWGASLCGDPAAGTPPLALLPPCRLALAVELWAPEGTLQSVSSRPGAGVTVGDSRQRVSTWRGRGRGVARAARGH